MVASNDREGEVHARDFRDHITVFTRIHILDYPRAERVWVEADLFPDRVGSSSEVCGGDRPTQTNLSRTDA